VQLTAYDAAPGAGNPQAQAAAQAADQSQAKAVQADASTRSLELLSTALGHMAARELPAPVIHNTVNVPEQRHDIHNHIASPAVEVRNQVNVPEPVVNVEAIMPQQRDAAAPVVHIVNDVQPAPVTVVDSHPTQAVQVVERDANDEILRTVTTYSK
jgi:hypothetical protein